MDEPSPVNPRRDAMDELRRAVDDAMSARASSWRVRADVDVATDDLLDSARDRSRSRLFSRAWAKEATCHEILAEAAEANGRRVTAAQNYHKAVVCLDRARQLILVDGHPTRHQMYESILRCHGHVMRLIDGTVTKHVIDSPEGRIFSLFHRAPGDGPRPTVVCLPDSRTAKEEFPSPFANPFAQRGMHVCVVDLPGRGECRHHRVWQTLGGAARAGRQVIDYLVSREDVAPGMIGVFGKGIASRHAIEIAADDPRIRAVAARMDNIGPDDLFLAEANPSLKPLYMSMTNAQNEAAFNRIARRMDERFVAARRRLWCPYLLVASDNMEPSRRDDVEAWMDQLFCPKELWYHRHDAEAKEAPGDSLLAAIADWLNEVLASHRPVGRDVRKELVL